MPKIVSRRPAWLSRTSPAFSLFNGVESLKSNKDQQEQLEGRGLRTLAHRGSEVFVADGNTVRWADLASMKANWESNHDDYPTTEEDEDPLVGAQYRVRSYPTLINGLTDSL